MQQTLLALCALVIASMFALNMRRGQHDGAGSLRRMEVEMLVANVAEETFDHLAQRPFDANWATATTAADLSPAASFGGQTWAAGIATGDLDDFDRASTTVSRAVGANQLAVTISARVWYVQKQAGGQFVDAGSNRQLYKLVRLTLSSSLGVGATMERVYALRGL